MSQMQDITSNRLTAEKYQENFCDLHPPLDPRQVSLESNRCYFCYDAPCIEACPTDINIPSFIRKISTGNLKGAAMDILDENIMGGTCARVCPVESLCEGSCVRKTAEEKPVEIGRLQRHATEALFQKGVQPFERAKSTGKKVAVVGAGPAGLSCAHKLARLGHSVTVYDAKAKAGGLNEYGLAPFKMVDDFAQKEVDFILSVGGIEMKTNHALGKQITLTQLKQDFDAVFLGMGLTGVNHLGLEQEEQGGVINALHYIDELRQAENLSKLAVGNKIVVIGGGSTAIDIAMETKRLGAEWVTLVYRRDQKNMKATYKEQNYAQKDNVLIKTWSKPHRLIGNGKGLTGVEFEKTKLDSKGKLTGTGEFYTIEADMVFKAIGQKLVPMGLEENLEIKAGKILVDDNFKTTLENVYAGGDCVNGGDLTVTSVQHGKLAAKAIHQQLTGKVGE